jgi:hypothetical protein
MCICTILWEGDDNRVLRSYEVYAHIIGVDNYVGIVA